MRVYWIKELKLPGRLGISARPRGSDWLYSEMKHLTGENISAIVFFLEKGEAMELGLSLEEKLCNQHGMKFIHYPIPDRGVPSDTKAYLQLIHNIHNRLCKNENILIHCRMGIGRTGITAAAVLVKNGFSVSQAFRYLSKTRTLQMPDTIEQVQFMESLSFQI